MLSSLSRRERRALAILLALGVAGHLIRAMSAEPAAAPIVQPLLDSTGDGDPLAHRDSIRQLAMPLADSERIDPNTAPVEELERLPGVGPSLAKRIVALRQSQGPFPTVQSMAEVRGIGPALLARLTPHLTLLSGTTEAPNGAAVSAVDPNVASIAELEGLPGIGPVRAAAIVAFRDSAGPFREPSDLEKIHGISAAAVRRLDGRLVIH
jgi:competence ComEA-like helix-hairpin-helix protein